ncbi:hypothetical protein LCGC14_0455900 [marine sediment metagenome]|uniref:Uncharacterized protein n=1 Tax=marine sediment metagenome TaxID=412755 RepID=A0A0F9SLU6_9ZZZZ
MTVTEQTIRAQLQQILDDWYEDFLAKGGARIRKLLDKQTEQIVLGLLGFRAEYNGKWQLDVTNGRSHNSFVGKYLHENAKRAVGKWLEKYLHEPIAVVPNEEALASARKEYERTFRRALLEGAQTKAQEHATKALEAVVGTSLRELGQLLAPAGARAQDARDRLVDGDECVVDEEDD